MPDPGQDGPPVQAPALPPERWVIVLSPEEGDVPPAVRVRRVLKYALRVQGLRCEAVLADVPADVCPVELTEDVL